MFMEDLERFWSILDPEMKSKPAAISQNNTRFVHYTTADVGIEIIRNKRVWMRKASLMNDFSEVEHGFNCLKDAFQNPIGKKFQDLLDDYQVGLGKELLKQYDELLPSLRAATYLTCVSEHLEEEDLLGRLSMWRAYGGAAGVAFVLNNKFLHGKVSRYNIFTYPVSYLSQADYIERFSAMIHRFEGELANFSHISPQEMIAVLYDYLKYVTLCTKHPGFREEAEWRVVFTPKIYESVNLTPSIRTVRGSPQLIYELPLVDEEDVGFEGASLPDLIDRIIIGPADYPLAIAEAFAFELERAGVENAGSRIYISEIPLRHR